MADVIANSASPKLTFDPSGGGSDIIVQQDATNQLLKFTFDSTSVVSMILNGSGGLTLGNGTDTLMVNPTTVTGTAGLHIAPDDGVSIGNGLISGDGFGSQAGELVKVRRFANSLAPSSSPTTVDLQVRDKVFGVQVMLEDPTSSGRFFQVNSDTPLASLGLATYFVVTRKPTSGNDTVTIIYPAAMYGMGYKVLAFYEP